MSRLIQLCNKTINTFKHTTFKKASYKPVDMLGMKGHLQIKYQLSYLHNETYAFPYIHKHTRGLIKGSG